MQGVPRDLAFSTALRVGEKKRLGLECCVVLCCVVLYCPVLYCIVSYFTALYCICFALHCTVLVLFLTLFFSV